MNIQKNKSSKKNQIIQQIKIEPEQLETLRLSEIFEEAKYLINKICVNAILKQNSQYTKNRLRIISEFTFRKLKSRQNIDPKRFIGLFSIFCFVNTATEDPEILLTFPMSFYRNLNKYIKFVVLFCSENAQKQNQESKKKFLSTFLYALVSLCQNRKKFVNLDFKKVLLLGTVKSLLKLNVRDDQRLMKLYRMLILYIYQNKPKNLPDEHLLKSLEHHFINCSSNKNTQSAIIFLLNRILKNKKVSISSDSGRMAEKVKKIIVQEGVGVQISRLGFSLLSKLVQRDNKLAINLLTAEELVFLVRRFYSQTSEIYRLSPSIGLFLDNFTSLGTFVVYRELVARTPMTNISLEIFQCITRKPNQNILFDFVSTNFVQKLIQFGESEIPECMKNLIFRIINNVVESNTHHSSLLASTLKRLVEWKQYSTLTCREPFIHYTDLY